MNVTQVIRPPFIRILFIKGVHAFLICLCGYGVGGAGAMMMTGTMAGAWWWPTGLWLYLFVSFYSILFASIMLTYTTLWLFDRYSITITDNGLLGGYFTMRKDGKGFAFNKRLFSKEQLKIIDAKLQEFYGLAL